MVPREIYIEQLAGRRVLFIMVFGTTKYRRLPPLRKELVGSDHVKVVQISPTAALFRSTEEESIVKKL